MTNRRRGLGLLTAGLLLVTVALLPGSASGAAAAGGTTPKVATAGASCGTTTNTEYATGTTSAAIGWAGNSQGVVACLSGSFVVINNQQTYGYGVYNASKTTWVNAEGYLPALVSTFQAGGATVSITDFGDKVSIEGNAFVVIYSRVSVTNPTGTALTVDPQPTANLTPLNQTSLTVAPHQTVNHDYAATSDAFGGSAAYPTGSALAAAGGFQAHFAHMRSFWNAQLKQLAQITQLPDPSLVNAYKAGFINTQITRAGAQLKTGVNGYDKEYSHDVIGILANLLTQGYTSDGTTSAKDLLMQARDVVGSQAQYDDGIWKYAWPWAIYLQKTGDTQFVKANFDTAGPDGDAAQPSIKDTAHAIAAARTGPGGIIEATNDIDANGLWTIDDYSALMGLAAYRWLAQQVGDQTEATWATNEYTSLLGAVNQTLTATIEKYNLNYLPCSMTEPNDDNRCSNPQDANWGAPFLFGRWAWDGYLFDATINGPGSDLIDSTYDYGFGRLKGILPPNTLGGYGDTDYSTGYNAGYGEWGLASTAHRDQGILDYQFMINNGQGGPNSWWESESAPDPSSSWVGNHPASGAGASPHAWGAADANLTLLDSFVAERGDGSLVVGRGVPASWTCRGQTVQVRNMPITGGQHLGVTMSARGRTVTLSLSGHHPAGPVLFQLPAFIGNLSHSSAGAIDPATGTVTLSASTRSVTVQLQHAEC